MKTTVTESAIREMVNEVLDNKDYGAPFAAAAEETPVVVNDVVDPSAAETDPGNPNFSPQDNRELTVAIRQIVKAIPDESVSPFYKKVKQVADDMLSGRDDDVERPQTNNSARDNQMKNEDKKIEETVRKAVRKMLIEMNQAPSDEEMLAATGTDSTPPVADPAKARKKWGEKASSSYEKKELMPFAQIAAEIGMSVAGAKQAVDKAWRKGAFIHDMFPSEEKKQQWVLNLISEYIDYLDSSGELDDADFELLRDHPEMISELPGFQDYLNDELKDAGFYPDMEFDADSKPIFRDKK